MSLIDNLKQISDFKGIQSLRYVLRSINVIKEGVDYSARKSFLDDSLIIIENKYLEQQFYRDIIDHMRKPNMSFNDCMDELEKILPNDHIQHKECVGKNDSNYSIRL